MGAVGRRGVLGAVGGLLAAGSAPAGAFRRWCRQDPIFAVGVDGQRVHLWVAVRADKRTAFARVAGAVEVRAWAPVGVPIRRLDDNSGFGRAFRVEVREDAGLAVGAGALPLAFEVRIPWEGRDVAAKVWLEALDRGPVAEGRARGRTGGWIRLRV